MKIAIDCGHGHNTPGKRCLNGVREWDLNSRIGTMLADMLSKKGYEIMRLDDTTGASDVPLSMRTTLANEWGANAYISIHHNAGLNGRKGGGTVVYYYSSKPERKPQAEKLYSNVVAETKLIGNRSSKVIKKNFYVLRKTKMPAFLLENGFMDSVDDMPIIQSKLHAEKTAMGIYNFILNNFPNK